MDLFLHMPSIKRKTLWLAAIFVLAGYFAGFSEVKAVTISPPFFDYSLNPGDTVSDVIKVYNETTLPITVYPIAINFTSGDDEAGIPNFYSAAQYNPSGLSRWISFPKDPITLKPGERSNLLFSIYVPLDGDPGGHYGGIIFSSTPPEERAGTVGVGEQLAAIMLLRVSGDIIEQGRIEEFGFYDGRRILTHLPVNFFVRFKNEGTIHVRPVGNVFITNMIGGQSASIKINSQLGSVLPNSIRRYFFDWKKGDEVESESEFKKELRNFGFGRYRATVVLNYGKEGQSVTAEQTFWVFPWILMVIAFVVLVLLVFLLKLYNRSVVNRYIKNNTLKE